ncbi:MFS transporter [Streptomyces chumphonensis]|uniref:MFS transporter n=1 Tax=Streptomyces chumphonensis TaxID=1214925 RepID=A0A927IFE4_9ACTN|nr:MFS transporter [Streptomyces chumphonensis]MBD3934694.1 MFS transporter [Streptomyces chumphonensis]
MAEHHQPGPTVISEAAQRKPQVPLLLGAVFLVFLGHMSLSPIIAPLSREVGLAEWQIGATVSTAALAVVLTSQFWGRRSQSLGRKPVLVTACAIATATMTGFAVVAWFGMTGAITGTALFVAFLLLRGVGFGGAIAAVPPTAQAYIADITTDEQARVKGMAGVGSVQAMAMVGGALVGGALSAFGLIVPLIATPVLMAAALLLLATRLRAEARHELIPSPAQVNPLDPRVWPFLVAGFGMFTSLGFIQVIMGFLVQDRLDLDSALTGVVTGGALLAAGVGLILAQAVIVPRVNWTPPALLRVGSATAVLGFILLTPDLGLAPLVAANVLIGVGLGLATPGYTAGPTLLVRRDEQGALAGLVNATNGLTFVVAPIAGTVLYGTAPSLPALVGAVIMAAVALFTFTHPRFREGFQSDAEDLRQVR